MWAAMTRLSMWVAMAGRAVVRPPSRRSDQVVPLGQLDAEPQALHECPICFGTVAPLAALSCGHHFCVPCITTWIHTKIEESNELALAFAQEADSVIPCPTCHRRLTRSACWQFVKESHSARLRELESNAELRRRSGAKGMFSTHESLLPLFASEACFCSVCWAVPIPMIQAVALLPLAYLLCKSNLFKAEVSKMFNCKLCPRCFTPIIKNGGCSHMQCRCGYNFDWKLAPWYCFHSKTAVLAALGVSLASLLTLLLAFDILMFRTCLPNPSSGTVSHCSSTFQSIRFALFLAEHGFLIGCRMAPCAAAGLVSILGFALYVGGVALEVAAVVALGGWHFVSMTLFALGSALVFICGIAPHVGNTLVLRLLPAVAVGVWHSTRRRWRVSFAVGPAMSFALILIGSIVVDVGCTVALPVVLAGLQRMAAGSLGVCTMGLCTLAESTKDFIVGLSVAHLRSVVSGFEWAVRF